MYAGCHLGHVSPPGQKTSSHRGCVPKAARDGASPNEKTFVMPLLGSHLLMPCCQSKSYSQAQSQPERGLIEGIDTERYEPSAPLLKPSTTFTEVSNHVPKPLCM